VNAVLVTKGTHKSPLLDDLKESELSERYNSFLSSRPALRVVNISAGESPFWRSLQELRMVRLMSGNLKTACDVIAGGGFSFYPETDSLTLVGNSGICISKQKSDSTLKGNGPDHLLRLFAYNNLMRKIGVHYYEKQNYEEEMFRQAEEAYVLCPLTSMIVLESENDYDRFNIGKNQNTVGNASVLGGGAVPEPHEWALICLFIAFLLLQAYRKKNARAHC